MKHILSLWSSAMALVILSTIVSCQSEEHVQDTPSETTTTTSQVRTLNYAVKNTYTHDTSLYTEGLVMHEGKLYESTGSPDYIPSAKSMIGISNLETGKFEKKVEIDRTKYFGEGIVFINGKCYQLTYTTQTGFIYDAKSFKKLGEFKFSNREGWALTTDGKHLIMSDGSNILTYLNPETLQPIRSVQVTQDGAAVDQLNELEFIQGYIFANVFMTDRIVKINPDNGQVVGTLDLSSLTYEAKAKYRYAEVLNGIAYDSTANQLIVTGKQWPTLYRIELLN